VLKASVEDRRIDFRLVEERGGSDAEAVPMPVRGQPAKRKKQKY
jgi:ribonuclease R